MGIWQTLRFGAQAVSLKRAAEAPIEEIEQIQRRRLEKLVCHAREHSDFYREKYSKADDTTFELSELPPSTKPELMENFDRTLTVADFSREDVEAFFQDEANLGQYFQEKYVLSHTSGSQGQPLLLVQTKECLELLFALQASRGNHESLDVWRTVEHFMEPARLAAVTLKRGFYPSAAAFEFMPEGAKQFIEPLRLSSTDENLLERLAEFRPTHLTAYASVLHELAREIERGGLTLKPELKQVVSISERLMPKTRQHYEQIFGAPVLDDYGMGECLFLTNGCPKSGGMHVNADWAILEVVDKANQPVPAGTKGAKVLITNLANFVQPIIRYEIGDVVTMATRPCGCGSNLPLVERIEGRDSDMFYIQTDQGAKALPPVIFEQALTHIVDAREYQIIQEDNTHFRIKVEPLPNVSFDRHRAMDALREQLNSYELSDKIEFDIEVVDRLAAEEDSKFKRIVSKVKPQGKADPTEADATLAGATQ